MKNVKNRNKQVIPIKISETSEGSHRANTITGLIIAIFIGISFYIRGIIPYERGSQLMAEGLTFAMDDAVFHMRLVENTIANYPTRIFFDAFTRYPYGNQLHWGALFEQTIATIAIIAGWIFDGGAPSQLTINTVGSFYPAVLGTLCVIPVYFIGKELMGRKAGIIAAGLTAILPGQFLSRSVLGFTDNHIAEVLFLTIAVMYFVRTLRRSEYLTFENFRNGNSSVMKSGLTNATLTGIFLGLYILNWTAGVFFVVVFGIFIGVQFVIDHLKSKPTEYLLIISAPIFMIPILLVSPYVELRNGFDSAFYSLLHLAVPMVGFISATAFYEISKKLNQEKQPPIMYVVFLTIAMGIGLVLLKLMLPEMYSITLGNLATMFSVRTGGAATVAEGTALTTSTAMAYFGLSYYFSFIGLAIMGYLSIRKQKPEHTLIVVWSIFILLITLAQVRFSYYYAINVALLTSVFATSILNYVGWNDFNLNSIQSVIKGLKPFPTLILTLLIISIFFYPLDNSIYKISTSSTKSGALSAGYFEWYYAMSWMKNNTPDTGLDYYGTYERPPKNEKYPYPKTAYGIMSWWDYGHVITYWGHRIPIANPFQAGVSEVAPFLTAQTEEEGNKRMDELGARYVVTDGFMAYGIQSIFATWNNQNDIWDEGFSGTTRFNPQNYYLSAIQTNQGLQRIPGMKTFTSMTGKLHILDTNGMQRYRLVHETISSPPTLNAKTSGGLQQEEQYKLIYNFLTGSNIKPEATGYVKIFEYVKGGNIIGKAQPNTTITVSLPIKTTLGREFTYTQTTTSNANGDYSIRVPYSTTGWEQRETKFDTAPIEMYKISMNGVTKEFDVTEKDIMSGNTVQIDLI